MSSNEKADETSPNVIHNDSALPAGTEAAPEGTHPLEELPSTTIEKVDIVADINHVQSLGIPEWEALQKKITRRLDMTLLPQLWVLYMFNYLNRVNIAQARLNTFNEDLNLKDGDYQVRPVPTRHDEGVG
jgi:hypothetical protein